VTDESAAPEAVLIDTKDDPSRSEHRSAGSKSPGENLAAESLLPQLGKLPIAVMQESAACKKPEFAL
jgi:hypothetical protein